MFIRAARLPSTQDQINNILNSRPTLNHSKHRRSTLSHLSRIPLHNSQVRTDGLSQIDLVHNQQIRARDTGSTLAGHLITTSDINHVDNEVSQLATVVSGKVVAAGFDEEEVGLELSVQGLQGQEVGADVFADGGVRAAAGFDGADAGRGEGFVAGEEFGVFSVLCWGLG